MDEKRLEAIGLAGGIRFTQWICRTCGGRCLRDGSVISAPASVDRGRLTRSQADRYNYSDARNLFESIERRIHNLHPGLREIKITHRWGGPILFRRETGPGLHAASAK